MLTATTSLSSRQITANGTLQVCFLKVIRNGDIEISREPHRAALPPGFDLDEARSAISTHLVALGFPAITDADWSLVTSTAQAEWTPGIVSAYAAQKAKG